MKTAIALSSLSMVFALGLPATSFAQASKTAADMVGAPGSKPKASDNARINKLDANGDGMISRAEVADYPKLSKAFNRIDVNKDEQLSREELKAFKSKAKGAQDAK